MVGNDRSGQPRAVPVLMLHSVAPPDKLAPHGWLARLATPPGLLESTFRAWKRKGWTTVSLAELEPFLRGKGKLPTKALVLTFDDGYVDNWVALHPLLRKYGFRATVFMSTDFIDPRPIRRPQVGNAEGAPLSWKGYLSWPELRAMDGDGVIDVQSHARTHAWYFVSDRIVDYYRPGKAITTAGSNHRFLWLNAHADRKPFALEEMRDSSVPWGTPVYENRPALVARRFVPDPREAEALVEFVAARGGADFFDRPDWRSSLDEEVERFRRGRPSPTGRQESEQTCAIRIRDELEGSRRVLSEGLGKRVDYLSFPQGGVNEGVEAAVRDVGYAMWTIPPSIERGLNRPGRFRQRVYRCGSGFKVFGEGRGPALMQLSQSLVVARHAGRRIPRIVLGAIAAGRRLLS